MRLRHGTASSLSVDQFRAFSSAVLNQLPADIDLTTAQGWIQKQDLLRRVLRQTLAPTYRGLPVVTHEECGADHSTTVFVCGRCANHESNMDWWGHCHECGGKFIEVVLARSTLLESGRCPECGARFWRLEVVDGYRECANGHVIPRPTSPPESGR